MIGRARFLPSFILAVCLVSPFATDANAQDADLLGAWRQVESNAGSCPTCQISIRRAAADLAVTASNGWSATVVEVDSDRSISASGHGRWTSQGNMLLGGKAFTADFILKGSRLYMTMRIDMGSGAKRVVKAVFERVWLGA